MGGNIETLFEIGILEDKVRIYHDESKEALGKSVWGHGLLFVPERSKKSLLGDLRGIRQTVGYNGKLRFADISESVYTPKYKCAKAWVEAGAVYLERKKGCKLGVIFFDTNAANLELYSGDKKEQKLRFVETVLKMVLQGSVHYLYNENWRIKIEEIITDGEPWHRKLDEHRIIERIVANVRNYVEFLPDAGIRAVFSDHGDNRCDDAESAELLQLTDLLLGSMIQTCLKRTVGGSKRDIISKPIREVLNKRKRGKGFKNSRHFRSFSVSLATIENNKWMFNDLLTKDTLYENHQGTLFMEE